MKLPGGFRLAAGLALLVLSRGSLLAADPAEDAYAPHTPTLIYYLTGAGGPADAAAITAAVQRLPSVSKARVDLAHSFVQVRFDSHVVSYHQVAQAIAEAGAVTGKKYAPCLKVTVPDYPKAEYTSKVDALFAGKRLNTRVHLELLDRPKGEFLLRFLPLEIDPADKSPQGFNGGHLNHPLHDPPPRGLGISCLYTATEVPLPAAH
jgi:copper chaperone CopZ